MHHRASGIGGAHPMGRHLGAQAPLQGGAMRSSCSRRRSGQGGLRSDREGTPARAGGGGHAAETRVSASDGRASEVGRVIARQEPVVRQAKAGGPPRGRPLGAVSSAPGRARGGVRARCGDLGTRRTRTPEPSRRTQGGMPGAQGRNQPGAPGRDQPRGGNACPGVRTTSAPRWDRLPGREGDATRRRETSARTRKVKLGPVKGRGRVSLPAGR